jgi:hypothetical protein
MRKQRVSYATHLANIERSSIRPVSCQQAVISAFCFRAET